MAGVRAAMVTVEDGQQVEKLALTGAENVITDIVDAVEESKVSGDHTTIHNILSNRQINLRTKIHDGDKEKTIIRKILDDAVSGDRIVEKQLDKSIKQVGKNEFTLNYGIEIDFNDLFEDGSSSQTKVLKEMLDMRRLLCHPVVATFIHLKWRKCRWYAYIHSAIFVFFLILYTFIIGYMFYRPQFCPQIKVDSMCWKLS